ncbi:MAG TPA: hypothetical protein VGO69_05810, partial [Pyrinomonadaceae bacterium]|nr:hypothetical protein [Pyrinomonadaceae bacterium]
MKEKEPNKQSERIKQGSTGRLLIMRLFFNYRICKLRVLKAQSGIEQDGQDKQDKKRLIHQF